MTFPTELTVIGTTVNHMALPAGAEFCGLRYDADGYPHAQVKAGDLLLEFATRDAINGFFEAMRDGWTAMTHSIRHVVDTPPTKETL